MYLSDFDEYERPVVKIPISPCHNRKMESLIIPEELWACPKCGLVYHKDYIKKFHTMK